MPNDPNSDFVVQPHLTAVAETYKNPDKVLIADEVLPRVPVGETLFEYQVAKDTLQGMRLPETRVGPRGKPNQLEMGMTPVQASTEDNALDIPLSAEDLKRGKTKEQATMLGTGLIKLRHEVDVASLVFDASNYATGFKEVVAGTDQFDNAGYDGDALGIIQDGLDAMLLDATALVFGKKAFAYYRKLPDVVSAVLGNAGNKGLVTAEQLANLFGVSKVLVGHADLVTSKPGEATVLANAWGGHVAALHIDRTANTTGGVTYGYTAEYEKIKSGEVKDADVGARGGVRVRTYESTKPVVVAKMGGYFWQNAVS